MSDVRSTATGVLTSLALLAAPASAMALANAPGGTQAPSAPQAGGSEYGVPARVAQLHPQLTALSVPSEAPTGRPPRVTLRVEEQGVGTVYVEVSVTNAASHRVALAAKLGWSHTARTLSVSWPAGAKLSAGAYVVSVTGHDHHGATLLRSAHSAAQTTLKIKAPPASPAPVPPPSAPSSTTSAPEAGVPTPAQTVADGAVFPVAGAHNFGGPENRFGAPREGHIHQGQDVLSSEGTQVVAPLAGTIESTSYQAGGAGYYAVEHTTYGLDFMDAHCEEGSFAVSSGQSVSAGQALCRVGQTGDATTPHLHFEMWVGGWQATTGHPIDPLPYLEAWERAAG